MKAFISQKAIVLLLVWLIVTGFNITKPVHFDDAAFLEVSQQIVKDPLRPLSQKIYWRGTPEPMYTYYHPLLIPYLYAAVIKLFGESEILLHIIFSFFSFGAILFFYLLASFFSPHFALFLTILFAVSPAFIPSQNLMTDIPLLTFFLAFFWAILVLGDKKHEMRRFLFAGCVLGGAVLIKYASLILIPIFLVAIFLKKRWHLLWAISIPIIVVVLWSLFNYFDYGGIHILSSVKTPVALEISEIARKFVLWIIGVGSVTPYSLLILPYALTKRGGRVILFGAIGVSLFMSVRFWHFPNEEFITWILRFSFFANGVFVFAILSYFIIQKIREGEKQNTYTLTLLALWFFGVTIYLLYFVPFVAIRHILLTVPPILILLSLSLRLKQLISFWTFASLCITVFLGFVLGVSDYAQAQVYRKYPYVIAQQIQFLKNQQKTDSQMWYTGNLDLQWYAGKAGMKQYDRVTTVFEKGDFLLVPKIMLHEPYVTSAPILGKVYQVRVPSTWATVFRLTTDWPRSLSGYYGFFWETQLPWSISFDPLEEFTVFVAKERGRI